MEDKVHGEVSAEERIMSEEEKHDDLASSSAQNLSIGRRIPGLVVPLVEGLIVGKKGKEDGSIDVTLILAPYVKKGVWIKAAITIKNSTKLSKKSIEKYRYPLIWGSRLSIEAVRNKGDHEWVKATVDDINAYIKEGSKEVVEEEGGERKKANADREESDSFHESEDCKETKDVLHRSPRRRSRRISALRKWSRESSEPEGTKKTADKRQKSRVIRNSIWGTTAQARRAAQKSIRSSSESQESNHKGELDDKEVWDTEEEDDGMVHCPFTNKDIRRFIDVKESIKGKAIERRFIRQALHNLYRHFTSLQTFVDTIRSKANNLPVQPHPQDMVWLEYHAAYIDCLLFENLRGMWADWNEPVLDLLMMSFLELTVRCSPRRQYPDKLEERVRRWMKKNQIGISTAFGPVPFSVQNSRLSERGVVWNNQYTQYGRGRAPQPTGGRGDGRTRGGSSANTYFRRGGAKAEGLNQLWNGNQVERHTRRAVHWNCASDGLKNVYGILLKYDNKALNLPECRAAFDNLTREVKLTYGLHTESKLINANEVVASKVALPKTAYKILPMLDLLPEQTRSVYAQPERLVSKDPEDWAKARTFRIAVRMPRKEYVNILKRMYELGMVQLRKQRDIKVINGLQCVKKDENKLRLIFDGRPANCVLQEPPKVFLPGFQLLEGWYIPPKESSQFGKIDLDNYYHRIGVPEWLKYFLGLPPISREEARWISGGKEREEELGVVCATLPMGLAHAVYIAQEIHVRLLEKIRPRLPLNKFVQSYDKTWVLVYIDDVLIGSKAAQKEEAARVVNGIIGQVCQAYEEVGLEVNRKKLNWADNMLTGLGCDFNGKEGVIRPSEERLNKLITATRFMLSLDFIGEKALEIILGHWIWLLLLKRPFFSILFNVYRLLQVLSRDKYGKFWTSAKNEFRWLIWLIGGIKMSWRRGRSGWIIATDASLTGAGACESKVPTEVLENMIWENGGFQDISGILPTGAWTPIFQLKWGYVEHINVLEARALVMCMSNIIQSSNRTKDRWVVAVDSLVVLGAVRKGRSSSYTLNNQLRRILVLCLIANAALDVTWIPTDINPADVLSRVFV